MLFLKICGQDHPHISRKEICTNIQGQSGLLTEVTAAAGELECVRDLFWKTAAVIGGRLVCRYPLLISLGLKKQILRLDNFLSPADKVSG